MHSNDYMHSDLLHAFIDGQLDPSSKEAIVVAMDRDPDLRTRVNQLRRTKDLMQLAFEDASAPTRELPRDQRYLLRNRICAAAASVLLLIGSFAAGFAGYVTAPEWQAPAAKVASVARDNRVVLHIGESDPARFTQTLAQAEFLLTEFAEHDVQVEVVANAGGLDLLRRGVSPFEDQVMTLIANHDNIHFIACSNSIRNLLRQGIQPNVMDRVDTGTTAVEHIVDRVQSGWRYIKIGSLPEA